MCQKIREFQERPLLPPLRPPPGGAPPPHRGRGASWGHTGGQGLGASWADALLRRTPGLPWAAPLCPLARGQGSVRVGSLLLPPDSELRARAGWERGYLQEPGGPWQREHGETGTQLWVWGQRSRQGQSRGHPESRAPGKHITRKGHLLAVETPPTTPSWLPRPLSHLNCPSARLASRHSWAPGRPLSGQTLRALPPLLAPTLLGEAP